MTGARRPSLLFLFSDQHCQKITGCYGDKIVRDAEPRRPGGSRRRLRQRLLSLADLRPQPDVAAHRAPPVRAGLLDQRRFPGLGSADARPRARGGRVRAGAHRAPPRDGPGPAARLRPARGREHSPNWIGIPRHDWACSPAPTTRRRESLERSGPRPERVRAEGPGRGGGRLPVLEESGPAPAGRRGAVLPDGRLHAAASAVRGAARGLRALRRARAAPHATPIAGRPAAIRGSAGGARTAASMRSRKRRSCARGPPTTRW